MICLRQFFILFLAITVISCNSRSKSRAEEEAEYCTEIFENSVGRDLEDIREDGVLRALVVYSSTSYFLYKGQAMGFEYELLQRLADHLDLKLELVISDDLDSQFEVLNRGEVDLIAHGMTITNERKCEVDFTEYLYLTRQVLVQKKPDNWRKLSWGSLQKGLVHDPIELIDDTVSIRKNSAYSERIRSLSNEMGGNIVVDTLDSRLSTGEIIEMVADGRIKYTIADDNLAKINASNRPILNIEVPVSLSQRIAWVTRKKSRNLLSAVNEWIEDERFTTEYNVIYNKYFKNRNSFSRRNNSDYYSLTNNQISKYDDLIKSYAERIGWDWRLLAAQIYQESKFDPTANSWAGAEGLMQLMPATAASLNIDDPSNPQESIRAGTRYLKTIYQGFSDITDELERIKLSLAAYNCGLGHVTDAQLLAEKRELDPTIWSGNVEKMLLELRFPKNYNKPFIKHGYVRGTEPVAYVNEIMERFEQYKQFITEE